MRTLHRTCIFACPVVRLESTDLNLLLAFEALVIEQSVTRAAARIGVSQPAMSNALSRLRDLLGDPVLERVHGRLRPTARARQLSGPVRESLGRLRAALGEPATFDADTAVREFRIAASDYVESFVLPAVVAAGTEVAPGISIRTLRPAHLFVAPVAELQAGAVDLAVGPVRAPSPSTGVLSAPLFEDRLVCLARKGHPRIGRRLDLDAFVETPHVRVIYSADETQGTIDAALHSRGLSRRVAMTVAHLMSVRSIVARTDFLAVVPRRVADEAADKTVTAHAIPFDVPALAFSLLWHERTSADAAHVWMRDLILTLGRPQSVRRA